MDYHGPACANDCTDQDMYSVCVADGNSMCLDDCSQPDMLELCMVLPSMCQGGGLDPTPVTQMCSTCYTLNMYDSYGDGWDATTWHWIDASGVDTTGTCVYICMCVRVCVRVFVCVRVCLFVCAYYDCVCVL